MKNKSIFLTPAISFAFNLSLVISLSGQDVGIGTSSPDYRLHVCGPSSSLLKIDNTTTLDTDIKADLFFKTGQFYTGGIKTIGTGTNWARLGLFTYATTNAGSLLERMSILDDGKVGIGTITPGFLLDVNGRMRIRNGGGTAGLYLMNAANTTNNAFIGMFNDEYVGFYGGNGAGWKLLMNTTTGRVGIGTTSPNHMLEVHSNDPETTCHFVNTSGAFESTGLTAVSKVSPGEGFGVRGEGGSVGVVGYSDGAGGGESCGVLGMGSQASNKNYGVKGIAIWGGSAAYGVYGTANNSNTNWAGYFDQGNVYIDNRLGIGRSPLTNSLEVNGTASKNSAGDWVANSDARLKKNIEPLDAQDMIEKLLALKGITYEWNDTTTENIRPEGIQYGFTAQNIQEVFPSLVSTDANGYLQTAYGTYDAMMVEAIRALYEDWKAQHQRTSQMQQQIDEQALLYSQLVSEMANMKKSMENNGL